jgi:rubrerythrin
MTETEEPATERKEYSATSTVDDYYTVYICDWCETQFRVKNTTAWNCPACGGGKEGLRRVT